MTKKPQKYIEDIARSSAYFSFNNGPVKELLNEGKITKEELKNIQIYMQNHLAYLYTVLLEENNLKKFDLVMSTMDKFYVDNKEEVIIQDDGFDNLFKSLFTTPQNIKIK
ncbi:hypothetical protein [Clostridium celatum]|uniref:Uncharacterized protein n=1 Tax=Clostridium celatum DSM 1785 TaxID=545697 RepID=L1Q7R9_9CLOT|nr:hypothetical protein [Clostridium celatum]EKY24019.1 hypothetical protein HMPREF0216_02778 [Clostridium celatum DSM 1785]MCE9655681.1 hypothetical protein [Clostridium celatum]MDU3723126.1 hypothetical protein [Clostridium celatum]MDU6295607.1 hypothetical protein [Clostridium celatum]MDY3360702.1 hypothetical protein [Clostridium celatum]